MRIEAIMNTEKAVLGCLLIEKNYDRWQGILTPSDFTGDNKKILEVIIEQYQKRRPYDILIIHERTGIPMTYLTEIAESVVETTSMKEYVSILKDRNYKQRITQIIRRGGNPEDIAERLSKLKKYEPINTYSFSELLKKTYDTIENGKGTEFKFHLTRLNELTGGFDRGELCVIGGYRSTGKTSLTIDEAIHFAGHKRKILYCTSEMSEEEIARRIESNISRYSISKFRGGYFLPSELEIVRRKIETVKHWDINIIRVAYTDEIGRLIARFSPDICIVDHLHNLSRKSTASLFQKTTENIADLQRFCQQEKVGMIVNSQLHRAVNEKPRRPRLDDFRSSGEIEEKATIALLLYWEARMKNEVKRTQDPELYEIDIAKNRDGRTGRIKVGFYPEYSKFEDWVE